jgi:hypothetical protein
LQTFRAITQQQGIDWQRTDTGTALCRSQNAGQPIQIVGNQARASNGQRVDVGLDRNTLTGDNRPEVHRYTFVTIRASVDTGTFTHVVTKDRRNSRLGTADVYVIIIAVVSVDLLAIRHVGVGTHTEITKSAVTHLILRFSFNY